jgi:hypothetical protein
MTIIIEGYVKGVITKIYVELYIISMMLPNVHAEYV